MEDDTTPQRRVCSIGAGRMGRALLAASQRAGYDVVGAWSRSAPEPLSGLVTESDVVFVAVPDAAIEAVLQQVAGCVASSMRHPLVVVTSGCVRLASLVPAGSMSLRIVRMHPAQTVTLDSATGVLDGVRAGVTVLDERDRADVLALASRLGMQAFSLDDDAAPAWHAATSIAAGGVTTLIATARDLAASAGVPVDVALDACATLARTAAEQAGTQTPEQSLTGPIARGDATTVAAHRDVIARLRPERSALYDELAAATTTLAGAR